MAALAIGGAALALWELTRGGPPTTVVREAPSDGAWSVRASFGPAVVERVERAAGTTHGATHTDPAERKHELRVSLTLTNRLDRPVAYSPGQFRLRSNVSSTTTAAVDPNPPPGALAAGETVREQLAFFVPLRGSTFTLVFDDVRSPRPLAIELGTVPRPSGSDPRRKE